LALVGTACYQRLYRVLCLSMSGVDRCAVGAVVVTKLVSIVPSVAVRQAVAA